MSSKLPQVFLKERPQQSTFSLTDIVHIVDLKDIQCYVRKKYIGQLEHPSIDAMQLAEVKMICDKLKSDGYEIIDLETNAYEKAKQEFDMQLKKETAKLRHEVSILAKKNNKLENTDTAKILAEIVDYIKENCSHCSNDIDLKICESSLCDNKHVANIWKIIHQERQELCKGKENHQIS